MRLVKLIVFFLIAMRAILKKYYQLEKKLQLVVKLNFLEINTNLQTLNISQKTLL